MVFTLYNSVTDESHPINVSYVWDNHGSDKYLVISDDVTKTKYTANTYKGNFDMNDVEHLVEQFGEKVLGWKMWTDWDGGHRSQLVIPRHKYGQRPNRCCHNDDFYGHYKKSYKVVGWKESGLAY